MSSFNVNIISGSVELREGELLLVNSESTINVRTELGRKESITNRAYSISADSTNDQYPTAKTVHDYVSSSIAEIPKVEEIWVRGTGNRSAVLSGSNSGATGQLSVAEGSRSLASGTASHAEGTRATASANYSHAEGYWTKALSSYSHAEGCSTRASGTYSHAEGSESLAEGYCAHAEGSWTNATGRNSHAEGNTTKALGTCSHAEGANTEASGNSSHAEGGYTLAGGPNSHAEGYAATASGDYSHAEGYFTRASGSYSHAEGSNVIALGHYSHAEGTYTIASNTSEHAQGRYNATSYDQIFSVGVGDEIGGRKNAVSIITGTNPSASIYLYGVGGYDGTNPTPGTNDVASIISEISASAVPTDLSGLFASASYDSNAKKIYFYDNQATASGEIDATAFIKDGMVDTVTINTGSNQMVITFNTDAGKEDIELNLNDVFNPSNYYTRTDVNNFTGSWTSASNWLGTNSASLVASASLAKTAIQSSQTASMIVGTASRALTAYEIATTDGSTLFGPVSYQGKAELWVEHSSAGGGTSFDGVRVISVEDENDIKFLGTALTASYVSKANEAENLHVLEDSVEGDPEVFLDLNAEFVAGDGSQEDPPYYLGKVTLDIAGDYGGTAVDVVEVNTRNGYAYFHGIADTASRAYSANLAETSSYNKAGADAKSWITVNSSSALAVSPASVTASINAAIGGITASHHTHSNKAVLDEITAAKTASWDSKLSNESDPIYLADSASLKASASLASSSNYKIDHAAALVINKGAVTTTTTQRYGPTGSVVTIQIPTTASHLGAANATHSHAIADVTGLNAIVSASQIVLAKTASWDASASVAKTASSSAAAISAKTGSWDALVGLPAVTAADNGKILRVVSGAWALVDPVTVYSGQEAPDSALGQDGDIYLQS